MIRRRRWIQLCSPNERSPFGIQHVEHVETGASIGRGTGLGDHQHKGTTQMGGRDMTFYPA